MTPSPTHDSEDWLDKQRAELEDAYYCMSGSNETQNEAAERRYEAAWQEIKDRFAHYLKPEDVEHYYDGCVSKTENGLELGHKCSCGLEKDNKESIIGHVNYKLAQL